jgi:hypothetical protein
MFSNVVQEYRLICDVQTGFVGVFTMVTVILPWRLNSLSKMAEFVPQRLFSRYSGGYQAIEYPVSVFMLCRVCLCLLVYISSILACLSMAQCSKQNIV